MKQLIHLVARTRYGAKPLRSRFACADLWPRLTRSFETIACTLMLDHLHLLVKADPHDALRRLARVLSAFRSRHPDLDFEWETLPRPERVQYDKRHIARVIRYIHLNPCRDALCRDPLEWEWSTHRDWIGAVAPSAVDTSRWARALGWNGPDLPKRLHDYVCTDPSVLIKAPPPSGARFLSRRTAMGHRPQGRDMDTSLDMIASCTSLVLRSPRREVLHFGAGERRLACLAANRWTTYKAPRIGNWLGCHPTQVRRIIRGAEYEDTGLSSAELRAIALTLSDPRLQRHTGV